MKTLYFQGEQYRAEKIVKTADSIYSEGKEDNFAFKGINDFSQFQLEDGQNFDIDEKEDLKQRLETTEMALIALLMEV